MNFSNRSISNDRNGHRIELAAMRYARMLKKLKEIAFTNVGRWIPTSAPCTAQRGCMRKNLPAAMGDLKVNQNLSHVLQYADLWHQSLACGIMVLFSELIAQSLCRGLDQTTPLRQRPSDLV